MDLHPKQFARVNVRSIKCEENERVVNQNFSVDPRTITLDRLHHLLARTLCIRQEFTLFFHRSESREDVPLTCDWDLEGALSEEPRIDLTVEVKPKEPGLEEWDIICEADVPVAGHEASSHTCRRKESFLEQVFHVRSSSCSPLTESEFSTLADWPCPLRYAVYRADGAEPSIRPCLWMHLLDVFPAGAGWKEREDFLNRKAEEYYGLRYSWQKLVQAGTIPAVLRDITCLVRKDVRRTDCLQALDEHALYNILTTYAVHHPSVGYCQGMSDLLSPLLHIMKTEARAYVAFCGLMLHMRNNFRGDGRSVCTKFRHLRRAIRTHDPQLHDYLNSVGAMDLIFCYRWLLLDLKREFPYEEMLTLMEVLWSTLRPQNCEKGVDLYEVHFPTLSVCESLKAKTEPKDLLVFTEDYFGSPKKSTASLKRWATLSRRQSIAQNMESDDGSSTDDEEGAFVNCRRRKRRFRNICRSWSGRDSIDVRRQLGYSNTVHDIQINNWLNTSGESCGRRRHGSNDSNYGSNFSDEEMQSEDEAPSSRSRSEGYTSGQESHQTVTDQSHSESDDNFFINTLNSFDSADTYFTDRGRSASLLLPSPTRLGDGKPFLIFMCLTMILNHRDIILARKMDASEIGIYFDHLVRKHRLADVLPKAKELFVEYLNSGWTDDD